MRIGTWNLAGRWSDQHAALIEAEDCDVWLLTEVNERTDLAGHSLHLSTAVMAAKRRWAAVASRLPLTPEADPHPASARARIGSTTYVSSVLPWRACGSASPWVGARHVDRTENAVQELAVHLRGVSPLVWGGDWNHALTGKEYAGSQGGRRALHDALESLRLEAATTALPHAIEGLLTIDHVAVPVGLDTTASRIDAANEGKRLSDHDAYVVTADL
ncbi:endonuclease/exonuclease/phosphatase family protein [Nocardioides sp. Soil805]|uniref:endonuclease/exonuclease/phosphatase family protein n=1 Tax=Nocardioides sp. Soil805 TaxID=1736416 RepID=UPI000702FAFE|nr:endonuclease/exonuclease/phosphatase family protein [Nocardioides sp. Soil805]KRF36968.1 hypothetical protein ASG94_06140 [Nocardioides sp. Soil805]